MSGLTRSRSDFPDEGLDALEVGGGATLVSRTIDTTTCPSVGYQLSYKPDDSDVPFVVEIHDGTQWMLLDGGRDYRYFWQDLSGFIAGNIDVFRSDLRVRLRNRSTQFDHAVAQIDAFSVFCTGPDEDGDGVPTADDCDDANPELWSACTTCVDRDGDGYGTNCDLGPDCHDGDALVFPGALDERGDGTDQSCDGSDGDALLVETFESGGGDEALWDVGPIWMELRDAASGRFSALLGSAYWQSTTGRVLQTVPLDAGACEQVAVSFTTVASDSIDCCFGPDTVGG